MRSESNANEYANVWIDFANVKQKPLATKLVSVFDMAKWKVNLRDSPLEASNYNYYEGIEVIGYNKHLVDAVAEAMIDAGLAGVRAKVETHQVEPNTTKWHWVQRRIQITIGH